MTLGTCKLLLGGMSFGCHNQYDHIDKEAKPLEARFLLSKWIPGIQKLYCIKPIPISSTSVLVREHSSSSEQPKKSILPNVLRFNDF